MVLRFAGLALAVAMNSTWKGSASCT